MSGVPTLYFVEPEQNIALARNRAVENSHGDFVAFIDDDEWPRPDWLFNLFHACRRCSADGALGPVIPRYESVPPQWVLNGRFHERPSHPTGTVLAANDTRTGNALLRTAVFAGNRFRPELGRGGEDKDLFGRLIGRGFRFVWCADAVVYEAVPPDRCTRSFMLRRALLRGQIPRFSSVDVFKSVIAVPLYTLALPALVLLGHHRFMKVLIKACDHLGRLSAACGIQLIKEKYIFN